MKKQPIIGVMGSGSEPHHDKAEPLGKWLAHAGFHLLTGGGRGVMEAVSRGFHSVKNRKGKIIGVLPGEVSEKGHTHPAGYPNPYVEIPIFTHLPLSGSRGTEPMSRNHINILTADVIIFLPGSQGTASEAALALGYNKPGIGFLNSRDETPGLPKETPVECELEKVKAFVREHITGEYR